MRGLAYGLSERAPEFLSTLRAINKDWGRKKTDTEWGDLRGMLRAGWA